MPNVIDTGCSWALYYQNEIELQFQIEVWTVRKVFMVMAAMAVLVISLAGCAMGSASEAGGLKIVTTIFPVYDLARQVAGPDATVRMLVKPGVEAHAFEPTPQDILAIADADVFAYIGGENDEWVDRMLDSVELSGKQVLKLIDCVQPLEESDADLDHADHGDEAHGIDEHIWTAPLNAGKMAEAIREALTAADPEGAAAYQANCDALSGEMLRLDAEFRALVDGAARKELIFGDRFPFRYFAEAYGLTCYAAFPSCANDTEPSAQTIAALIDRVKADGVPVVFTVEQSNGRVAKVIADAAGVRTEMLHACHNVTKAELDAGATVVSLMTANVESLRAGLY